MTQQHAFSAQPASRPYNAVMPFPLAGKHWGLGIHTSNQGLQCIDYLFRPRLAAPDTPLARDVVRQLQAYFADPQYTLELPLDLQGTDFQRRLWRALGEIHAGHSTTYGQLAKRLHSAAQAVGQACRRNPVPIVVPCHRVLSAQGIGGYSGEVAGEKLDIKQALLRHEGFQLEAMADG